MGVTVGRVRVATWNLWWRFGGNWAERQRAIAATLVAVEADIVCCQEVWAERGGTDQAARLAEQLGMDAAHCPRFGEQGESFGNAILSRFPIVASELHSLAVDGRSRHRSALVARIARDTDEITVVCTHLEHRHHLSEIRQGQAATLCELAAAHHDPDGFPVVLAGDFNAVPSSEEIRLLTGERPPPVPGLVFNDAWAQADDGPGHTWSRENPYLAEAMWPNRRLDYVFVSAPRAVPHGNVAAARLFGTEAVDGVMASDHYGVAVDLID